MSTIININGVGVGVGSPTTPATISSLKRKSFTMGSNNSGHCIKGGGKSRSKPPKFKFVFPSNSHSSNSHESSNASGANKMQTSLTPSGSKNKINQTNNDYLLVSQTPGGGGGRTARKLSEFSVGEYSITYGNGANYNQQNHQPSERASKDFEHISYRARQSRRDVVKMLCK